MATTERDDDYLICSHYKRHINDVSAEYPGFITFEHQGNHFFAWVNDGEVVMRSEAYPSMEKVERGIKAILKNREITSRFDVIESHGAWFSVLYGGGSNEAHTGGFDGHNEIGRSCPKKSKEELLALYMFRGEDYAHAVVPGLRKAASGAGIAAAAATTVAASSIAASTPQPERVTKTPAAAAAASTAKTGGGFNWLWLLPLLLIPLLWFGWKGCNGDAGASKMENASTGVETPKADEGKVNVTDNAGTVTNATNGVASGATVDNKAGTEEIIETKTEPETAKVAAPVDCDLNWILFDFDKYNIRSDARRELSEMAEILKKNATYVGVLKAHTDSRGSTEYNDRLSRNRAKAAKDVLVSMGISASRIQTSASSEGSPYAQNTDDDSGRKFNRRVELFVEDGSGKEVCKSIPPAVPSSVKR